MRDALWRWLLAGLPEGALLPRWALVARAVLFPLDTFYWHMHRSRGYRLENDTWVIRGVTFSGLALYWLAQAQGETYRVTRTGDTVTLERVTNVASQ